MALLGYKYLVNELISILSNEILKCYFKSINFIVPYLDIPNDTVEFQMKYNLSDNFKFKIGLKFTKNFFFKQVERYNEYIS